MKIDSKHPNIAKWQRAVAKARLDKAARALGQEMAEHPERFYLEKAPCAVEIQADRRGPGLKPRRSH